MSPPERRRGRPRVKVVLPDGRVVYGRWEAARTMGYTKPDPLFEKFAVREGDGWRILPPRDNREVSIELPDGRVVVGWKTAAHLLGIGRRAAQGRAVRSVGGEAQWRVLPPRPRLLQITLWDGTTYEGWERAAAATGETIDALRWRSVPTTGGYHVAAPDTLRRRRRRYANGAVKHRGE